MSVRNFGEFKPQIDKLAYVDVDSTIIGNVKIGKDSSIWPQAVIRGDMHSITIGERTSIQDCSVLHITHKSEHNPGGHPLLIGSNVTVGHKVTLHGCTIEDKCIIGIDAVVLDGAVIESNTILAAGSIVPPGKVLEKGYLWMGAPAVRKRELTDAEKEFILYSANNYVKLKNQYLQQK
jgi:carbonic anhydrase/acetyltransferase-like protein (isoleucine patch superfamily)